MMGENIAPPFSELLKPIYALRPDGSDMWWRNIFENPTTVQFDHRILVSESGRPWFHLLAYTRRITGYYDVYSHINSLPDISFVPRHSSCPTPGRQVPCSDRIRIGKHPGRPRNLNTHLLSPHPPCSSSSSRECCSSHCGGGTHWESENPWEECQTLEKCEDDRGIGEARGPETINLV